MSSGSQCVTVHDDGSWTGMDGQRRTISLVQAARFLPAMWRVVWKQVCGRFFLLRDESDHFVEFIYVVLRESEVGSDNWDLHQEAAEEISLRLGKARQGGAA